jgi:hypothetical protein
MKQGKQPKSSWLDETIDSIVGIVSTGCRREEVEDLLEEKFKESFRNGAYAERKKRALEPA